MEYVLVSLRLSLVLWRFGGASTDPLVLYLKYCRYSCVYPGEGAGVSGSP